MVREVTNKVIEAIKDEVIDPEVIAMAALAYMSEDDVADMVGANDLQWVVGEDEDEDDEEDVESQFFVYGDYGLEDQTLLYETTLYSEATDFFKEYTRDPYDLGNYYTVEMGYFLDDGEWVDLMRMEEADRDEEDLHSDLD